MLIAGNWKMNGDPNTLGEFGKMIARAPEAAHNGVTLIVCPPAILTAKCAERATVSPLEIGGQDCHPEPNGAHTGDIAAEMLAACGATTVIVGHSERRADHGEDDALVAAKATAAQRAGLRAIVCVGETEAERDAGNAETVVNGQLAGSLPETLDPARLVVAYEPVWAIGTGRTPSTDDVAAMHAAIRKTLDARFPGAAVPILYGGSVKPSNAAELLAVPEVGGALIGGASLKADDFLAIALAAVKN
ncbi:triose-phosphate isomerase [Acuticoccus sp. MNP-M23]|uniref:triose-phosphate isomerase n=1 Tax=Acuticoccus sp. MNP-M23 TaxID=3072793 RepID=UPI0028149966|nr:triose-phosphate isomerase [Acuticoccus sp. MNP-M23]WMS41315.1 triose-phosphate isomerase [Acuticoccus sp. MNP-M23]